MTKFHVQWLYDNGATALTDVIDEGNGVKAHNKAQKIALDLQTQDPLHRKIVVGTITRLQT